MTGSPDCHVIAQLPGIATGARFGKLYLREKTISGRLAIHIKLYANLKHSTYSRSAKNGDTKSGKCFKREWRRDVFTSQGGKSVISRDEQIVP